MLLTLKENSETTRKHSHHMKSHFLIGILYSHLFQSTRIKVTKIKWQLALNYLIWKCYLSETLR